MEDFNFKDSSDLDFFSFFGKQGYDYDSLSDEGKARFSQFMEGDKPKGGGGAIPGQAQAQQMGMSAMNVRDMSQPQMPSLQGLMGMARTQQQPDPGFMGLMGMRK